MSLSLSRHLSVVIYLSLCYSFIYSCQCSKSLFTEFFLYLFMYGSLSLSECIVFVRYLIRSLSVVMDVCRYCFLSFILTFNYSFFHSLCRSFFLSFLSFLSFFTSLSLSLSLPPFILQSFSLVIVTLFLCLYHASENPVPNLKLRKLTICSPICDQASGSSPQKGHCSVGVGQILVKD